MRNPPASSINLASTPFTAERVRTAAVAVACALLTISLLTLGALILHERQQASSVRKVIAERSGAPGSDLVSSLILFLLALYKLNWRFRRDVAGFVAPVVLAGAILLLENLAVFRMAEAAGSPVITEDFSNLNWVGWSEQGIDGVLAGMALMPLLRGPAPPMRPAPTEYYVHDDQW